MRRVACLREIMVNPCGSGAGRESPRAHRAQTFLRTLGIEVAFSREGRMGARIIKVNTTQENTVSTVRDFWQWDADDADARCRLKNGQDRA
jgi:hypothetical protein